MYIVKLALAVVLAGGVPKRNETGSKIEESLTTNQNNLRMLDTYTPSQKFHEKFKYLPMG